MTVAVVMPAALQKPPLTLRLAPVLTHTSVSNVVKPQSLIPNHKQATGVADPWGVPGVSDAPAGVVSPDSPVGNV